MVCYSSHYLNTRLFCTIFRYLLWPEYQTNIQFSSHKLQSEYGNHLNTKLIRHSNGSLKNGLKKPVYGPKCLVFKWSTTSWDLIFWIPDTHADRYSGVLYLDHLNLTQITLIHIKKFSVMGCQVFGSLQYFRSINVMSMPWTKYLEVSKLLLWSALERQFCGRHFVTSKHRKFRRRFVQSPLSKCRFESI